MAECIFKPIVADILEKRRMVQESYSPKENLMLEDGKPVAKKSPMKDKRTVEVYEKRIHDYVDGFTVHGLTKVFKAQRKEAVVWMCFIIIGLIFAGVVIGRLIVKYYKFETYTEIRAVVTDRNTFPSLSVCDFNKLQSFYFSYCGSKMTLKDAKTLSTTCDRSKLPGPTNGTMIGKYWQNEYFEVQECYPWDSEKCVSPKYLISRSNGVCFTWNYNGKFSDLYGHVDLKFRYRNKTEKDSKKPRVIIILHDPDISEMDLTKKISIESSKRYEVMIGKSYLVRKPEPYSSCVSSSVNTELDIFPGAYDRRTCRETYKQLIAFKKCGDIFDNFYNHLPNKLIQKYGKHNKTIDEVQKCIRENVGPDPPKDFCPIPCKELSLTINSNTYEADTSVNDMVYQVDLQLENVDTYTVLEEMPLYSSEQMSAEIGGFLGLVVGASLLSFIELFACGALYLMKRFYGKEN